MILSFAILFSFLFLGDTISSILNLSIPGNVIGMVLLTIFLCLGWIKDDLVKPAAKLLLDNMALLFVPAGVGLMEQFNIISKNFTSIAIGIIASTFITLAVTAHIQQALEKKNERSTK